MVYRIIAVFGLGLVLLLAACIPGKEKVIVASSVDSARTLAASTGFILVDLYSKSCVPCKVFDKAVNEDERIQNALDGVVLVRLDVDSAEGNVLATKHLVRLTPTFLLMNPEAEVIGKWIGYDDPNFWIDEISALRANPVSVPERESRFASSPTFEDAIVLGDLATSYRAAYDYFRSASSLDPVASREEDVPILIFRAAFFGVGTREFTTDEAGAVIRETLQSPDVKQEYVMEIGERLFEVVNYVGVQIVEPFLRDVQPYVSRVSDVDLLERRQQFLADYADVIEKNPAKARQIREQVLPQVADVIQ